MVVEHTEIESENSDLREGRPSEPAPGKLTNFFRKLSACFDIYELPDGESLVFSKNDLAIDSVPALINSTGEVFGLEFSVKIKGGPVVGVHNFTNGATGRFVRGSRRYRYRDCRGQITNLTLRKLVR
ncbi:MAG: hypothetical protein H6677_19560 [Candidatus Obscuribacterales bacterium]|nr:hypothetical protein [Cyanobacteria bacterium HKST-UBA01]MCB9470479.1 hypothetical protein [Candidatus Obscuribacterales bacterium]